MVDLALSSELLRTARAATGMTQEAAARRAGLPLRTLTRAEAGHVEIRATSLAKLAMAYGVPMEAFFAHPPNGEAALHLAHPPDGGAPSDEPPAVGEAAA